MPPQDIVDGKPVDTEVEGKEDTERTAPASEGSEKKLAKRIVYHKVLTYLSAFHLLGMGPTYLWYGDNKCFVVLCGDVAHHVQILQHCLKMFLPMKSEVKLHFRRRRQEDDKL